MNREDVIRMAREADDWVEKHLQCTGEYHPDFHDVRDERFAALVAAAERRKHQVDIEAWKAEAATAEKWRGIALAKDPMQPGKAVQEIQRDAMELEREACAKVCESRYMGDNNREDVEAKACAAAIRARNQP